jgi:hypothetical protein
MLAYFVLDYSNQYNSRNDQPPATFYLFQKDTLACESRKRNLAVTVLNCHLRWLVLLSSPATGGPLRTVASIQTDY